MKKTLFEYLNEQLKEPRKEYKRLMLEPDYVESLLQQGATKARKVSQPFIGEIRAAVGLRSLGLD